MNLAFEQEAHRLFNEAMDLAGEARPAFLAAQCGDRTDLLSYVQAMLQAADADDQIQNSEASLQAHIADTAAAALAASGLQPGRELGAYRISTELGKGGMGVVYAATHQRLNKDVAIKVLPHALADQPAHIRRFQREAETLAALNHPNIVHVYDIDRIDGIRFMVMERVSGRTLSDILDGNGMPLADFLQIAIPLCSGLAAAHARGVVHRDLKPGNIMIDDAGRLKILDFGLAALYEEPEATTAKSAVPTSLTQFRGAGTPPYMSPEQLRCMPPAQSSDIFSLGVVLYRMLTGHMPFQGGTHAELVTAILRDAPPSLHKARPDMPGPLLDAVTTALAKEPKDRKVGAEDLAALCIGLRRSLETGSHLRMDTEVTVADLPRRLKRGGKYAYAVGLTLLAAMVLVWRLPADGGTRQDALRRYQEARRLYDDNQMKDAAQLLGTAVREDPELVQAWALLSHTQSALGRRKEAQEAAAEAYRLRHTHGDAVETYRIEGTYYMHRLEYAQALDAWEALVKSAPTDAPALRQLGHCYAEMGMTDKAVAAMERSYKARPDEGSQAGLWVQALVEDGRFDEAVALAVQFEQRFPEVTYLYWSHGLALLGADRVEAAIDMFAHLIQADEDIYQSWGRLLTAKAYILSGRFDEAAAQLTRNLTHDNRSRSWDTYFYAKLWLARLYTLKHEPETAASYLTDLAVVSPDLTHMRSLRRLGILYAETGDAEAAERVASQLEAICRETPSMHSRRAFHHVRGAAAVLRGTDTSAEAELRRAWENLPDPLTLYTRAGFYLQQGDAARALEDTGEILEAKGPVLISHFPGIWVQAWYMRGQALEARDRREEAVAAYARFLTYWGDADLTSVHDARRRLARLRDE